MASKTIASASVSKNVIGLYIKIDDATAQTIRGTMQIPAITKSEVVIEIGDERKEFTFEEFFKRLGFEGGI